MNIYFHDFNVSCREIWFVLTCLQKRPRQCWICGRAEVSNDLGRGELGSQRNSAIRPASLHTNTLAHFYIHQPTYVPRDVMKGVGKVVSIIVGEWDRWAQLVPCEESESRLIFINSVDNTISARWCAGHGKHERAPDKWQYGEYGLSLHYLLDSDTTNSFPIVIFVIFEILKTSPHAPQIITSFHFLDNFHFFENLHLSFVTISIPTSMHVHHQLDLNYWRFWRKDPRKRGSIILRIKGPIKEDRAHFWNVEALFSFVPKLDILN